ncbi:tRNA nucleotidyltransferase [Candidatus Uzinura diaspidicola str. ASNER]|uniref:tRNA nucleotidyltransferase n=1 Tax=Candidatus Uzinura diaspidicola str. ASNER TaxID=1133592 RepID=L7VN14_9FLAO|nr:tRNA nucleotidyltransferase [Candidatus Uzinura diaspidicola str. ASNER]
MNSFFHHISVSAKEISQDTCVIGKYVISSLLNRNIYQYVDILTEGSGILLAQKVFKKFYQYPTRIFTCFKRFGTARFKNNGKQIEFIGDSDTIVEYVYSIAISLNVNNYGLLIDHLNISSEDTFSMIRSIRFASEVYFTSKISFYSIFEQRKSIIIPPIEGIINDLNKIILSPNPSFGLSILYETGFLSILLPEVTLLKEFEEKEGSNHKDNFSHTLEVVDNVSEESNSLWLRWVALLHDIGKSITKKYIHGTGWTFYAHEGLGARIIPYLFHRLKFPLYNTLTYVQKIVKFSSRPIALVSYEATDSAIRRLLFYVGADIEDLLIFCKADITTKNIERKLRYMNHFLLVERKLLKLDEKDSYRNWPTPISGNEIMQIFQLQPSHQIGIIKKAIKEAILDGKLANDFTYVYYSN